MRKFLILLFVLFAWQTLPAQDKIITANGDTILCRIISVSNNHIVYEQQTDKKLVSGKIIPLSDVAEYFRVPAMQSSNEIYVSRVPAPAPEQPWLISVSVGGAYLPWLLESITEEFTENDDYKKLDKGFSLNANVHYLITDYVGFGVQYSFFTSGYKSNYSLMLEPYYPTYTNMDIRERQYVNYAGLSVIFRQFLDKNRKLSLSETLSGGLLLYRAEGQYKSFMPDYSSLYSQYSVQMRYFSQNALITGNTFGATIGISAEYKLLPYFSVGLGGNFMYGSLSKASSEYKDSYGQTGKSTDEKLETPRKLSRIDYSLVLRFQL